MVRIIGKVVIVGRIDDEGDVWSLVSIHDDYDEAVAACRDARDFVVPVELHQPLPETLDAHFPHGVDE